MTERDDISRLADTAAELLEQVQELTDDEGRQIVSLTKRSRTNRRLIVGLAASIVLDIILTIALAVGLVQIDSNAEQIGDLTHRLDVTLTATTQRALCPLYQLFLDFKSPEGRKRSPDPAKYDRAFEVIGEGYRVLKCSSFIERPR